MPTNYKWASSHSVCAGFLILFGMFLNLYRDHKNNTLVRVLSFSTEKLFVTRLKFLE